MAFFRTLYAAKLADIAVMDERVSLGLQKLEQGAKVPPPPRRRWLACNESSHCTGLIYCWPLWRLVRMVCQLFAILFGVPPWHAFASRHSRHRTRVPIGRRAYEDLARG